MKAIYSFILLICFLLSVSAQTETAKKTAPDSKIINAAQLLRDDEILSADEMQGRGIGTAGGIKARQYVADRFKSSGVKSFENSYFPENTRTPLIFYIAQTVISFKKPTSGPSKTFIMIVIR